MKINYSNEECSSKIDSYALFLFRLIYLLQFLRYVFKESAYKETLHLVVLVVETTVISFFLFELRKKRFRSTRTEFLIIVYFIYAFFACISRLFIGLDKKQSTLFLITDMTSILMMFFHYALVSNLAISNKLKFRLRISFLRLTLILIFFSIVFQKNEFLLLISSDHAYASNLSSIFLNRNMFGYYLFLFLIVYITKSNEYIQYMGTPSYFTMLGITSIFIVLTLSRTAISSTLLLVISYAIRKLSLRRMNSKQIFSILIFNVLLLSFCIYLLNSESLLEFFISKVVRSEFSTSGRTNIWTIGFNNLRKNPLFGIGSFVASGTIDFSSFHNLPIEILVRNGYFGFFLKVSILISIIRLHASNYFREETFISQNLMFLIPISWSFLFESHFLYKIEFRSILLAYVLFVLTD